MSNEFILIVGWKPMKWTGIENRMLDSKGKTAVTHIQVEPAKCLIEESIAKNKGFFFDISVSRNLKSITVINNDGLNVLEGYSSTSDIGQLKCIGKNDRNAKQIKAWGNNYVIVSNDGTLCVTDSSFVKTLWQSEDNLEIRKSSSGDNHIIGFWVSKNYVWYIDTKKNLKRFHLTQIIAKDSKADEYQTQVIDTNVDFLCYDECREQLLHYNNDQVKIGDNVLFSMDQNLVSKMASNSSSSSIFSAMIARKHYTVLSATNSGSDGNILCLINNKGKLLHAYVSKFGQDGCQSSHQEFRSLRLIVRKDKHFLLAVHHWLAAGIFLVCSSTIIPIKKCFSVEVADKVAGNNSLFGSEFLPSSYSPKQSITISFFGYSILTQVTIKW